MKQILLITLGLSVVLLADFTKSGNIVTDNTTGLEWQDDAIGSKMRWSNAIDYCENLTLDTHSDWRLPNIKEFASIMDDTKTNPSIDNTVFQNTASNLFYWSSTTPVSNFSAVWNVQFGYGYQFSHYKTTSNYVRCVRAGQ